MSELVERGVLRLEWARVHMPVLRAVRDVLVASKALKGLKIGTGRLPTWSPITSRFVVLLIPTYVTIPRPFGWALVPARATSTLCLPALA